MGGPVDEDDRVSEAPPRRLGTDPKMLGIVFGVLGIASLIAVIGAILAMRKSATQEKKEEEPTAPYAKEIPSASASGSESASASPPAPAPSALAKGFGWLTLEGPAGTVMVKGKPWGESGTKLAVPCGQVWVGIAKLNDKGKVEKTFTKPQSILVKCGGETVATAKTKS
jgi:hypothetical protein